MTRKTKIRIAMGLLLLGIVAWIFWLPQNKAELDITFTGVRSSNSNRVSFIITNTSKVPMEYRTAIQNRQDGDWLAPDIWLSREDRILAGQSTVTVEASAPSRNPWRLYVIYARQAPPPLMHGIREKLAEFSNNHHWQRLGQWFDPEPKFKNTYGPKMIGNRSVSSARP